MGEKSSKTDLRLACNRTSLKYMLDTLDENGLGQSTTGTGVNQWGYMGGVRTAFFVLSTTYLNKLADKVWRPGMFVGIGIWEHKCTHGCYPTLCKLQWGLVLIFCWFKAVLPCLSFSKITYMAVTFQPEKTLSVKHHYEWICMVLCHVAQIMAQHVHVLGHVGLGGWWWWPVVD